MSTSSLIRARCLHWQQPRTRKPIRLWSFLLWFLLLTGGGIFCLWTCLEVRTEKHRIARAKADLSELLVINNQLRGEAARLESPARVEKIAKEQIGLGYPEPDQVVSLGGVEETKKVSMAQP